MLDGEEFEEITIKLEEDIGENRNEEIEVIKRADIPKTQVLNIVEEKEGLNNIVNEENIEPNEQHIYKISQKKNSQEKVIQTVKINFNIEQEVENEPEIQNTTKEIEFKDIKIDIDTESLPPRENKTNTTKPKIMDPNLRKIHWIVVYFIVFMMGIAFLLPYNAFITALDYYKELFGDKIEYQITVSYTSSIMLSMGLILFLRSRDKRKIGILISYIYFLIILIILPLFYYFVLGNDLTKTSEEELKFAFWITMITVFSVALMEGLIQASLYGMVAYFDGAHELLKSRLPPDQAEEMGGGRGLYTQSLVLGCSTSALIASANRIVSKYVMENSDSSDADNFKQLQEGTLVFFAICAVIIFISILLFIVLQKFPFAQKYLWGDASPFSRSITKYEIKEEEEEVEMDEYVFNEEIEAKKSGIQTNSDIEEENNSDLPITKSLWRKIAHSETVKTWIEIKFYSICMFLNFIITLMIFPGFIIQIPSRYGSWFPVILVAIAGVCDFIGRSFGLFKFSTLIPSKSLYLVVIFRAAFVPLFVLCVKPYLFRNELFPVVFLIIFMIPHGVLSVLLPMRAPKELPDKDLVGRLMVISLIAGLNVGAVLGYILDTLYFDYFDQ